MDKRQFLGAGIGASLAATAALAQPAPAGRPAAERPARRVIPVRKAKTVPLFLTPPGWPNAIAVDPDTAASGSRSSAMTASAKRPGCWISRPASC